MAEKKYYQIASIAEELRVPVEDVETVAMVEVPNDEWDDDMECVDESGRLALLEHFMGGADPA